MTHIDHYAVYKSKSGLTQLKYNIQTLLNIRLGNMGQGPYSNNRGQLLINNGWNFLRLVYNQICSSPSWYAEIFLVKYILS